MSTSDSAIKVSKRRGFTVVYNDMLPEGAISARAWGLYVYLVGRPDGWETRVSHLRTVFSEGRDAIYAALNSLVDLGLMGKESYLDNGLRRTRYTLDADQTAPPQAASQPQTRRSSPDPGFQDPGNPDVGLAPDPGFQDPDFPDPENPTQVTKERTTTEVTSKEDPPSSLRSDGPPAEAGGEPDGQGALIAQFPTRTAESTPSPRRKKTKAPEMFRVTAALRASDAGQGAVAAGLDLDRETQRFLSYHRAKGTLFLSWDQAWRYWMTNAVEYSARRTSAEPARASYSNQKWVDDPTGGWGPEPGTLEPAQANRVVDWDKIEWAGSPGR